MIAWLATAAHANALCDELLRRAPRESEVVRALEAGDDPDALCTYTERVPMIQTFGGALVAAVLPLVSWPIVFTERVDRKARAWPLALALRRGREDLVSALLRHGARPREGMLEDALREDAWGIAGALIDAGASPVLARLEPPLVGDPQRLARAVALRVRFDGVTELREPGRLLTDPVVADAFLDAGLAPELLLVEAAEGSHVAVLDRALARGTPGAQGYDALAAAALAGRWTVAEHLHAAGVPWERPGSEAILPRLVEAGSATGVQRALALGAAPEARTPEGEPALQLAANKGRIDLVASLVAAGASVDVVDALGATALVEAAETGRVDVVKALLAKGAAVDLGAPPPLEAALDHGHLEVAGLLLARGAVADDELLRRVVASDRPEALRYLLQHGVSPLARLASGEDLAQLAVRADAEGSLGALIAAGAPLDDALLDAAALGRTAVVTRLLDAGVDPAAVRDRVRWDAADAALEGILMDRIGATPPPERLLAAVRATDVERARRMLAHGASPDAPGVFEASRAPEMDAVLVEAGGRPPGELVGRVVEAGDVRRLARLRVSGAEIDPHWMRVADEATATYALSVGANADAGLWSAVATRHDELVATLVGAGAGFDLRLAGLTPIELAVSRGDGHAVDALLAAGQPYVAAIVRFDAERCAVDRLAARPWADEVAWRELRPLARAGGCRREVRRVASR